MTDKDIVLKLMDYQFNKSFKETKRDVAIIGIVTNSHGDLETPSPIPAIELKLISFKQFAEEILTKSFTLFDIDQEARPYIILKEND